MSATYSKPTALRPTKPAGEPIEPALGVATVTDPDAHEAPRGAPHERSTRQKRALAAILQVSDGFRSAQELHAELQAQGENIALTTIYNQVRALADAGELDALRSDDGEI